MHEKSVFRVGAAGLDPRDWRLIEIVFRHSQYNRYEFRLVARVETDGVDILIANRTEAQGLEAIERVGESIAPVPVIDAVPRGATSSSRHAISIDRLTLQLLPILNRVVETELLPAQEPAAGGAGIAARPAAAPAAAEPAAAASTAAASTAAASTAAASTAAATRISAPPVRESTAAVFPGAVHPAATPVRQAPAEAGVSEASTAPQPSGVSQAPGAPRCPRVTGGSENPDALAGMATGAATHSALPAAQAPRATQEPSLPTAVHPEAALPEPPPEPPPEPMHREPTHRESMGRQPLPEPMHRGPPRPESPLPETAQPQPRSNLLQFPRAPSTEGAGRLRVLVVDDSPTVRRQLAMAFERLGLACDAASSAAEALDRLEELHYDLVLVDVVMPDMDGYKLTREIRRDRRLRGLPVIILTSRSSPFDLARGALAGCDTYLTKPVPFRALEAAVLRQLRRSLAIDDLAGLVRSPDDAQGGAPERPAPVRSRVARFFGR